MTKARERKTINKRIRIYESDALLLEDIKKKEKITNTEELLSRIIHYYFSSMSNRETDYLKRIEEYVKLLVKSNSSLPSADSPSEMYDLVYSESRFENLIASKIKDGED